MSNEVRVNEAGQKVFTITDARTGEVFEHVQVGRGRPPKYAPLNRLTVSINTREGKPSSKAFFINLEEFEDLERAVRNMRLVDVTNVRGSKATILQDGKKVSVPTSQLVAVEVS